MPVTNADLVDPNHRPAVNMDVRRKPYDNMSPRDAYVSLCAHHGCKVNSGIAASLSNGVNDFDLTDLDLSNNILGAKGIIPLLEVTRLSKVLHNISLKNNHLDNGAVRSVVMAFKDHPSLESIDFSGNPISWTAGMHILDLVNSNSSVQNVALDGTFLKPNIIQTINEQTRKNQSERARRRIAEANPTNHPLAIRVRALKRIFNDVLSREGVNDKVPKRCITEGYKENMRMQRREAEIEKQSVAFYEDLKRRCNADEMGMVEWSTFLIVSMIDDIWYDDVEVSRIKEVFERYDADGNGYIDLAELKGVMSDLYHDCPSDEMVLDKMRLFDADGSNTLTLDEFMIMMIDKGPQVGTTTMVPEFPSSQPRARHF